MILSKHMIILSHNITFRLPKKTHSDKEIKSLYRNSFPVSLIKVLKNYRIEPHMKPSAVGDIYV